MSLLLISSVFPANSAIYSPEPIIANAIVHDGVVSPGEYAYSVSNLLGGRCTFYYTIITDTFNAALECTSSGWISMGWGSGKMRGDDIVTGYYDVSTTSGAVFDMAVSSRTVPPPDAVDDILSSAVMETGGITTMEFSRYLNTGDTVGDIELVPGVVTKFMFASHTSNDDISVEHNKDDRQDITLQGPPSAPRSLQTTVSESRVDLSWLAPLGDGGQALQNYNVMRSHNGASATVIQTTTSLSYSDLTVINGENYTYWIIATNSRGDSGDSNHEDVIPMGPLLAPQNLVAIPGSFNVSLTWLAPASDGGIPVDHYNVYRRLSTEPSFTQIGQNTSTLGYLDIDVINGFSYIYYVEAKHQFLVSDPTANVTADPVGPPPPPLNLVANWGDNVVYLNWSTPVSDGGSAMIGYTIKRSDTEGGPYNTVGSVNASTLYFEDTSALNAQTYYYVVIVNNSYGNSLLSNEQRITLAHVPTTPSALNATVTGTYVYLFWNTSDFKGFTPQNYSVYRTQNIYGSWDFIGNNTQIYFNDTSINIGETYYYRVTASNEIGESSYSNILEVYPASVPSEPRNLQARLIDAQIQLTFEEPINSGGYFVFQYEIYRDSGAGFTLYDISRSKVYYDTDITTGNFYSYKLKAVNQLGPGDFSEMVSIAPGAEPDAPTNLTLSFAVGQIFISWIAPEANLTYHVYRSLTSGEPYTFVGETDETSYIDFAPTPSEKFYVVTALNNAGESTYSIEASIISASVPDAPSDVTGVALDKAAALTWTAPYDGGFAITAFRVYKSTDNITYSLDKQVPWTYYIGEGLTNNMTYYLKVSAVTSFGEGNTSEVIQVTPQEQEVDTALIITPANQTTYTYTEGLDLSQIGGAATIMTITGGIIILVVFAFRKRK